MLFTVNFLDESLRIQSLIIVSQEILFRSQNSIVGEQGSWNINVESNKSSFINIWDLQMLDSNNLLINLDIRIGRDQSSHIRVEITSLRLVISLKNGD
jgi:hypothetical protein